MNMSKAALPPKFGHASKEDERHPLFPVYRQYRSNMSQLLVNSDNFSDWLYCYEAQMIRDNAAKHDQYPAFMQWMRDNQGGARRCPAGAFPHNFHFWLNGGRW